MWPLWEGRKQERVNGWENWGCHAQILSIRGKQHGALQFWTSKEHFLQQFLTISAVWVEDLPAAVCSFGPQKWLPGTCDLEVKCQGSGSPDSPSPPYRWAQKPTLSSAKASKTVFPGPQWKTSLTRLTLNDAKAYCEIRILQVRSTLTCVYLSTCTNLALLKSTLRYMLFN